jgi:pimeloyl-ACP methyl ester carboxylesterase
MRRRLALLVALSLFGVACSAPVGVKRVSPERVHYALTSNVLSTGELSGPTQILLRQYDLTQAFKDDPEAAIAELHGLIAAGTAGEDDLFGLAELSFYHAQAKHEKPHFLAAALYAYAFLFPDGESQRADGIDPRVRVSADIYNRAITEAFTDAKGEYVELRGGLYELPFGSAAVTFDAASLRWGNRTLVRFVPVAELEVHGLRNRYRRAGIGAPLAAVTEPIDATVDDFIPPKIRVPTTAVLHVPHPWQQLATSMVESQLVLYAANETETVEIDGFETPLEVEPSAALASALAESRFWDSELSAFLGRLLNVQQQSRLVVLEPHRAGRIPVVFVHGTASSYGRWADMVNDLQNDASIRDQYEMWLFVYDSGNPIAYSSMLLRRSLKQIVDAIDPEGDDRCLRNMVVIGHSQGGLLTKMTVIDSGDRFWNQITSKPFDRVELAPEKRALIEEAVFVKPLPPVKRVVYIATPHRGSYLAGPDFIRRLAARLITLPTDVLGLSADIVGLRDDTSAYLELERIPTSIDNMSPGNAFIQTLASIPIDEHVKAHSIIAVNGDGPIESGSDGVVRYQSAHVDGVESELIIRSGHSVQCNPRTVAEVRRILRLHAEESACRVAEGT